MTLLSFYFCIAMSSIFNRDYDYSYISLSNSPGISIVETRKIEMEKLKNDDPIPTKYLVTREKYNIKLYLGDTSVTPHVFIIAQNSYGENLKIKPKKEPVLYSETGAECKLFGEYEEGRENEMVFFYFCKNMPKSQYINFSVIGDSGETLGNESIHFNAKKNGYYTVIDGL